MSAGRLGRSCTRGRGVPFTLLAAGRAASLAAGGAADAEVPLAESLAAVHDVESRDEAIAAWVETMPVAAGIDRARVVNICHSLLAGTQE